MPLNEEKNFKPQNFILVFLRGSFFPISDEQPRLFHMGVTPWVMGSCLLGYLDGDRFRW